VREVFKDEDRARIEALKLLAQLDEGTALAYLDASDEDLREIMGGEPLQGAG
jgi:hypothetical protein